MSNEEISISAPEATLLGGGNTSLSSTLRSDTSGFILDRQSDNIRKGEELRNRLFLENEDYHKPCGYMEANEAVAAPSLEFFEVEKNIKTATALGYGNSLREMDNISKTGLPDLSKFISTASIEGQRNGMSIQQKLTLNEMDQNTPISKLHQLNQSEDPDQIGRAGSFQTSPEIKRRRKMNAPGRFFQVLYFINSFMFQMKKILLFFRPHQLNSLQLDLIADNASHPFEQDVFGVPYPMAKDSTSHYGTTQENDSQLGSQSYPTHRNSLVTSIMGAVKQKSLIAINNKPEEPHHNNRFHHFLKHLSKSSVCLLTQRCKRKALNILKRILRNTLHRIPLIDPTQDLFRLWELLIFICDTINLIYIPFRLSFVTIGVLEIYFYRLTFPVIYSLNILFHMNVSVYSRGTLIISRQMVISMYFRSFFILDILALCGQFIHPVLYLARLLYSNPTLEQLKSFMLMNSKFNAVQEFISLSVKTLIFSHFFSCAWHLVGKYNAENHEGWMVPLNIMNQSTYVRYITCFYYAVVTMSTIGYGEITANTTNERLLMIFSIFMASGLYGYTLNAIGTILSNLKNQSENYSKKQAQLEEYLALHEVDIGLRNRARKYIEYAQQQENMLKRDGQENLNLLNSILKEEIQKDINKKVLMKARGLFQIISSNVKFFERLQGIIKEQTFGPEEIIYIQNSAQPPALYIIAYGEVELFLKKRGHLNSLKVLQSLKTGCIFGQYEFFTNNQSNCLSARSVGVTYISSISLDEFQQLLLEFQEEKEKFYNIRDQILTNQANHLIKLNCLSCQSDKHTIQCCPYLFYDPISSNHEHLLMLTRRIFDEDIKLAHCNIRKRNKFSSTGQRNCIEKDVEIFQMQKKEAIATLLNHIFPFQDEDQDNFEGSLAGVDQSFKEDTFPSHDTPNENEGIKIKQSTFSKEATNNYVKNQRGFTTPKLLLLLEANNSQLDQNEQKIISNSPELVQLGKVKQSQDPLSDSNSFPSELSPSLRKPDIQEQREYEMQNSNNNNNNNITTSIVKDSGRNRTMNKSLTSLHNNNNNNQQLKSLTFIDNDQHSGIIYSAINQQNQAKQMTELQLIQQIQQQLQQLQHKQDVQQQQQQYYYQRMLSPSQQAHQLHYQSFLHSATTQCSPQPQYLKQFSDQKTGMIVNNSNNFNPLSQNIHAVQHFQQQLSPSETHKQQHIPIVQQISSSLNQQINQFQRANSKKYSNSHNNTNNNGNYITQISHQGQIVSPRRIAAQIAQQQQQQQFFSSSNYQYYPTGVQNIIPNKYYQSKEKQLQQHQQLLDDTDNLSLRGGLVEGLALGDGIAYHGEDPIQEGENNNNNNNNMCLQEIYSWENSSNSFFDQIKNFQIYFPHNNFENIASKWNDFLKAKTFKRTLKRTKKPHYANIKQSGTPQSRACIKNQKSIVNSNTIHQFS